MFHVGIWNNENRKDNFSYCVVNIRMNLGLFGDP